MRSSLVAFVRGEAIRRGQSKRPEPTPDRQRVNEEILAPRVRLIGANGEQLGVVSLREALNAAREQGLDLVEVASNADPPVCKVLDYGKFQYLQMKKHREARKSQKVTEVKEIRLRPKTDDYHQGFKVKQARRFLAAGMKVKVRIQFRGREITHPEIGREQLKEVVEELADVAVVEQHPNMEGRSMLMVMAPLAAGAVQHARPAADASRGAPVVAAGDASEPADAALDDLDDDLDIGGAPETDDGDVDDTDDAATTPETTT